MKKEYQTPADEKKYKCILIDYLISENPGWNIAVEVPYFSGKRRVDLLAITAQGQSIAFEIKSDVDSLDKLSAQVSDYQKAFDFLYLVVARKFVSNKQIKKLPSTIGLIEIYNGNIIKLRNAKLNNPLKKYLVRFLWKNQMLKFGNKSEPIETIRNRILHKLPKKEIHELAIRALLDRYTGRYELFLREKSARTHPEDIDFLTKKNQSFF